MKRLLPALSALALTTTACSLAIGSAAEVPPAPAGVVRGGTLRIGITTPASIDPAQAYDRSGQLVVSAMCNPLVEVDPKTGEAFAGVTKHIVQEKSGAGITLTLKDKLRFADGTKASAKDVRASLSRVASDTQASPLADEVKVILGFEFVHGDKPLENEDSPLRTTLAGAEQVTSTVVKIVGSSHDAELPAHLARPWTAIVPAGRSDASSFGQSPTCVGPYRVARPWDGTTATITLVRAEGDVAANEAFTGGGRGYPDRIEFHLYDNDAAAFVGWMRGEVDVAPVPRDHLGSVTPGGRVVSGRTPALELVGLPVNVAPFDKAAVRAALSVALDREALIAAAQRPDRVAAGGVVPSTVPGGYASAKTCRATNPARGNVAEAQKMLSDNKLSLQGQAMKLYFNDEPGSSNRALMQAVAEQWRSAFGALPELVALSWTDYLDRARSTDGFDGPFRTSWASPVASPGAWIDPLALPSSIPQTNFARYSTPQISSNYAHRFLEQNDHVVRRKLMQAYVSVMCAQAPLVPIWQGTNSWVVRDNVKSATDSFTRKTTGELGIRELYVTRS